MLRAERAALSIISALAEAIRGRDTRNALSFSQSEERAKSGGRGFALHHVFQRQFLFLQPVDQVIVGGRSGIFDLQLFIQFSVLQLHGRHMTCVHRDLLFLVVGEIDPFDLATHRKTS